MSSAVELVIEPRRRPVGNHTVMRVLPWRLRRMVGPFIFADLFGPDDLSRGQGTDIDAHPHIGLSTLTYLFEGRLVHRDSTGAVQEIAPGAVNWMSAGSGAAHTERSHPDDRTVERRLHGLQTWVALPDEHEDGPPSFEHVPADSIPEVVRGHAVRGQVTLRLIAGWGWGETSPVSVSSPLALAQVTLADGAAWTIDSEHRERAVLAIEGDLTVAGQCLAPGRLAVLEPDTRPALGGSGRAVVLGGEPVGRRQIWWNFVHSDPQRIEQAKSDWTAQRFPPVPGDHDNWIPLPA
jgi:redox-sensitive bicupin YhaK (pirin superfamily)